MNHWYQQESDKTEYQTVMQAFVLPRPVFADMHQLTCPHTCTKYYGNYILQNSNYRGVFEHTNFKFQEKYYCIYITAEGWH